MASASTGLNIKQTFSGSPAQADVLREVEAKQALARLAMEAAEKLSALALQAFALARDGNQRANEMGTEFLDRAERLVGEGRALDAEAVALWRQMEG
jgi:hypothetical protein